MVPQAGTYYYGACFGTCTGESDKDNNCSEGKREVLVRWGSRLLETSGARHLWRQV